MLTSAVFLRAAPGISTTRLLRTGARSSYTAIAGCSLLLQSKERSSVTFADRVRKDGSHTPTVSLSPNNFARTFHASAVCRTYYEGYAMGWSCTGDDCEDCDCDWDDGIGKEPSPICEICNVNPTAHNLLPTAHELASEDHVTVWATYTSYCKECAEKRWEEERRRKEAEAKIAAARQKIAAARRERVNKMLEHVKSLPPGQQVPIAYAIEKVSSIWSYESAAMRHRDLRDLLSEELQIVKVGTRWKCDKGRVDAMDFELWDSGGVRGRDDWGVSPTVKFEDKDEATSVEAQIKLAGAYREDGRET
ncbi:hypothetical protein B0H65DRAFT_211364 [Neurospora tetraspora]|uniref:Uncharacterized protein n=1 Tax=Neurospora tetraspora TaxID=94610 RepID=A0AAE0MSI0_9PEZI|nr:hypothetical protein B0H65DRAFT_211364 [Neurospora tetraspora]